PVGASAVRRRSVLTGVSAAGLGWLAGCTSRPGYPAVPLRIASGSKGGVYYDYAHGIEAVVRAVLPRLRPKVLVTAASLEHLRLLASGRAELAFTTADAADAAYRGQDPFTAAIPVEALARIYE